MTCITITGVRADITDHIRRLIDSLAIPHDIPIPADEQLADDILRFALSDGRTLGNVVEIGLAAIRVEEARRELHSLRYPTPRHELEETRSITLNASIELRQLIEQVAA